MGRALSVFIGHDRRETPAYGACCASLRYHSQNVLTRPISRHTLSVAYTRPTEERAGGLWDVISNAPMATDFSLARFWVPLVAGAGAGHVLFCDCDFLWRAPVEELFDLADSHFAVQVVQHPPYRPQEASKMDGRLQTDYPRKNWSSLMLINAKKIVDNDWLPPLLLNNNTGVNLHGFHWLRDDLIGALPAEWNWLEGVSPPIPNPKAVHFTRGTPDMPGYEDSAFADEWRSYAGRRA